MSYTLRLSQDHDGRRLDRTIRKGEVRVNGVRVRDCGEHVHSGDELCVPWPLKEEDLTLALGHILISHHVRREFGSPVLLDALNGQSELTDYLPLIDRRLWRGI